MRIIYVDGFIRRADFFSRSRLCDKEKDEKDIPEADDDLNVHERMHINRHRSFSSLPLPSPRLLPPLLLLTLLSLLLCTTYIVLS